eukprot:1798579-Pyramimonas_sp.AAC.1
MCHSRALSCPRGVTHVSLASFVLPSRRYLCVTQQVVLAQQQLHHQHHPPSRCYTCVTRERRPALTALPMMCHAASGAGAAAAAPPAPAARGGPAPSTPPAPVPVCAGGGGAPVRPLRHHVAPLAA